MRIWPIYKKELRLYFTSPVAYVLLTIFLLIGILPNLIFHVTDPAVTHLTNGIARAIS